jgi:hypothetical protein
MKRLFFAITIISLCLLFSCEELPETFKVIYHGGEDTTGFPPTDNKKYKSGEYATVLDQHTLLKEGYDFKGWNTKADNLGEHYDTGDTIEIKNINIFLFAVWE